jgi:hypothetical protein
MLPFAGTTAVIKLSETTVNEVAGIPLKLTAEVPLPVWNPLPLTVTIVLAGPDDGLIDVIIGATQEVATVPLRVKSSSLKTPLPEAPVRLMATVTVPVSPVTGLLTAVTGNAAPVLAGIEPEPTAMPFIVIDQFCGPEGERTLQN